MAPLRYGRAAHAAGIASVGALALVLALALLFASPSTHVMAHVTSARDGEATVEVDGATDVPHVVSATASTLESAGDGATPHTASGGAVGTGAGSDTRPGSGKRGKRSKRRRKGKRKSKGKSKGKRNGGKADDGVTAGATRAAIGAHWRVGVCTVRWCCVQWCCCQQTVA